MKARHKRLALILVAVTGLTGGGLFVLNAFRSNLVYFYSPTQVLAGTVPLGETFRLGGLVERGSVRRSGDGQTIRFVVTDLHRQIPVRYHGVLPDLFRPGQGVVTQGRMVNGRFVASQVLAKHDEKYMPPEVAQALHGGSFVPAGTR